MKPFLTSKVEKDVLKFCMDQTSLPITLPQTFEGNADANPKTILEAVIKLKKLGMITRDKIATNRGMTALVVECGVPFLQLYNDHLQDFASMASDVEEKRKILGSDDYYNIFQYYFLKQHLEKDLFTGDDHHFKVVTNSILKTKMELGLFEALLEDGRIPMPPLLTIFGVPPGLVSGAGLDKDGLKRFIIQAKNMY